MQLSTGQLARMLVPEEPAGKFVSHELMESYFNPDAFAGVRLFARPVPVGSDLCRREVTFVSIPIAADPIEPGARKAPSLTNATDTKVQIAAAPQCKATLGAFMAWVEPKHKLPGAEQALRRLLALQEAARKAPSSIEVSCRTAIDKDVCSRPAAQLLLGLPTDRIFIIQPDKIGWRFSIMPNGPGPGLYWNVRLHNDRDKVELEWNVVPPA